jgi:DNA-binding NarL/FixJ family response regulator
MENRIKVLIVDDQVLFAESLSYVLKGAAERVEVVGIAHDGEEAVEFTRKHRPDVILMDVRMPRLDGVEATKLIHLEHPAIRIVVLTTFDDDEYVHAALRYGAVGYLLKNIRPEPLVASIHAVMGGARLFDKAISARLLKSEDEGIGDVESIIAGLSRREKDLLNLVMQMKNNRQMADTLGLSDHSVRNYMSSLYRAFDVRDRMELIQKLRANRLLA